MAVVELNVLLELFPNEDGQQVVDELAFQEPNGLHKQLNNQLKRGE